MSNPITHKTIPYHNQPQHNFYNDLMQDQRTFRTIQSRYLQDQYNHSIQNKQKQKEMQKFNKKLQHQAIDLLHKDYQDLIKRQRQMKAVERNYLSDVYEDEIRYRQHRINSEKTNEKQLENKLLYDAKDSWLRTIEEQRNEEKRKRINYSQHLQSHVKAAQQKKMRQKQIIQRQKMRISEQSRQLQDKQYRYMQMAHQKKAMFEERQNALLGTLSSERQNSPYTSRIVQQELYDKPTLMKKKQRQLYGMGLQAQRSIQQQRRKKQIDQLPNLTEYNPITNPIPYRYKNPNVIRMLSGK